MYKARTGQDEAASCTALAADDRWSLPEQLDQQLARRQSWCRSALACLTAPTPRCWHCQIGWYHCSAAVHRHACKLRGNTAKDLRCVLFEVAKPWHGLCSEGVFRKGAIARSEPFETLLTEL